MLLLPIILWWAKSPMRFSVGRSRQWICLLSLWAIAAAALPMTRNVIASEPVLSPDDDGGRSSGHIIREGTVIPPTQGRVVMLGRRWAFVPDASTLLNRQLKGQSPNDISDARPGLQRGLIRIVGPGEIAEPATIKNVGSARFGRVNRLFGPVSLVSSPTRLVTSRTTGESSGSPATHSAATGQIILAENLMLQRIVASLRSDVADDRWILSGAINEFFGENRMAISSAQRGSDE